MENTRSKMPVALTTILQDYLAQTEKVGQIVDLALNVVEKDVIKQISEGSKQSSLALQVLRGSFLGASVGLSASSLIAAVVASGGIAIPFAVLLGVGTASAAVVGTAGGLIAFSQGVVEEYLAQPKEKREEWAQKNPISVAISTSVVMASFACKGAAKVLSSASGHAAYGLVLQPIQKFLSTMFMRETNFIKAITAAASESSPTKTTESQLPPSKVANAVKALQTSAKDTAKAFEDKAFREQYVKDCFPNGGGLSVAFLAICSFSDLSDTASLAVKSVKSSGSST